MAGYSAIDESAGIEAARRAAGGGPTRVRVLATYEGKPAPVFFDGPWVPTGVRLTEEYDAASDQPLGWRVSRYSWDKDGDEITMYVKPFADRQDALDFIATILAEE
jgi:hypothetical protein